MRDFTKSDWKQFVNYVEQVKKRDLIESVNLSTRKVEASITSSCVGYSVRSQVARKLPYNMLEVLKHRILDTATPHSR